MIKLKPITWDNLNEIKALETHEHQKKFLIPIVEGLAVAYIRWKVNGMQCFEYGIYNDDMPIGYVQMEYTPAEKSELIDNKAYYMIWDFMIDKNHQGQGLGRAAMVAIIEHLKTEPEGTADYIVTYYVSENVVVAKLFESFGFEDIGERSLDGDIFVSLKVK